MSVNRYDRVPIGAKFTEDGYLEDSPVLTRTGVFVYRDGNGKERRELRRPEDVGVHKLPARLLRDSSSDGERRTEPPEGAGERLGPSPRRGRPCPQASCT